MQIHTLRLLKVFILLIDILIQLIKHSKETAEVIIILRCIIEDQLSVALYKHSTQQNRFLFNYQNIKHIKGSLNLSNRARS